MSNQIELPRAQLAEWIGRWSSNQLSWEVRREIDAEILGILLGQPQADVMIPPPPDHELWLTDEMLAWCQSQQITFTASFEEDPHTVVFIFDTPEQATQFAVTWL